MDTGLSALFGLILGGSLVIAGALLTDYINRC